MRLQYLFDKAPLLAKAAERGVFPRWEHSAISATRAEIMPASVILAELIGWARGPRVVAGVLRTPLGATCVRFTLGELPGDDDAKPVKRLLRDGDCLLSEIVPMEAFRRLRTRGYVDDWHLDEDKLAEIAAVNEACMIPPDGLTLLPGEYVKAWESGGEPDSRRTVTKWYMAGLVKDIEDNYHNKLLSVGALVSPDWPHLACQRTHIGCVKDSNPFRWDGMQQAVSARQCRIMYNDQWCRTGYDDAYAGPVFRNVGIMRAALEWTTRLCCPTKRPLGYVVDGHTVSVLCAFSAGALSFNAFGTDDSRKLSGAWVSGKFNDFGALTETDASGQYDTRGGSGGRFAAWLVGEREREQLKLKLKTLIVTHNLKG